MKDDLNWLEGWFVKEAESWVGKYVEEWEDSALDWAVLGFADAFNDMADGKLSEMHFFK
ncbi:hypothetical protein MD484_g2496, partial [Candolleomyces efflorescens]